MFESTMGQLSAGKEAGNQKHVTPAPCSRSEESIELLALIHRPGRVEIAVLGKYGFRGIKEIDVIAFFSRHHQSVDADDAMVRISAAGLDFQMEWQNVVVELRRLAGQVTIRKPQDGCDIGRCKCIDVCIEISFPGADSPGFGLPPVHFESNKLFGS